MDIQIELIDPKKAEMYLMGNSRNRSLRKTLVASYAKDMAAGRWRLTHQGVAFNCDGTLLDGQHRLSAIIESGVPVEMVVARGIDADSQITMDDHAKRSAGDALSLARGEKVSSKDVAIVRGCIELMAGTNRDAKHRLNKQQLNEIFGQFRDPLGFIRERFQTNERGITSAPVKSAICLAWFYVRDLDRLGAFCEILTGRQLADGPSDKAAVMLREWLLRSGMKDAAMRAEGFRKTQRAIVAFAKYQEIGKLYGTTAYYPWPLVDPIRVSGSC